MAKQQTTKQTKKQQPKARVWHIGVEKDGRPFAFYGGSGGGDSLEVTLFEHRSTAVAAGLDEGAWTRTRRVKLVDADTGEEVL